MFPWIERLSKFILCSKTFELTPVTQLYITEAKADCHILHPIYPYVASSGHNMQRLVVKWVLFTFFPRHSQWRERISTLTDVLIAFVHHSSQFKVRNQSDPFNRVALFRRQPRHARERGIGAIWTITVWKLPWRLIKNVWNYNSRFIYYRRLVTCIVPFTCSVTKGDICHDIFAYHLWIIGNYALINVTPRGGGITPRN